MAHSSIYTLLQDCTVRIETDTDRGTGFFVAPGQLLTCAHVVRGARADQLRLRWKDRPLKVTALDPDEELDLALLTLEMLEHPCVYLRGEATPGDGLYSYGYPDPMEKRDGMSLTMECEGTGDRGQILSLKGENIRPGFSGAPVLNQTSLSVCGLIRTERGAVAVPSPRIIRAIGGQAVPLEVILKRWPALTNSNEVFHQKNRIWMQAVDETQEQHNPELKKLLELIEAQILSQADSQQHMHGWLFYDNWANAPGGVEEPYLVDENLRLRDRDVYIEDGLSVTSGMRKIRIELSSPKSSVRLVGLSGVGKTRLVQALFDERVGDQAIDPNLAIYTDLANSPHPIPIAMAEQLVARKNRAVLVVDNCPPDLHKQLTQICGKTESKVSLLTVEYDVRDDLPEETSIYRLEPASKNIIQELIQSRYSNISRVDAATIADFSEGNARVALALARTVDYGETLGNLRSEEIFKRLLWQRNEPDDKLLVTAEICSLVYSFEGEDTESNESELKFLANLANQPILTFYRNVQKLKNRDLVQSRSVWRAVLPHAIANRLAKQALESIPKDKIANSFISRGSERLLKSFTRRLGYLHDAPIAGQIVKDWLGKDGYIGEHIATLSDFGMTLLSNIAPVSPESTLEAIERAAYGENGEKFTSREHPHYSRFVRILRLIAYDSELFERCFRLLCRYALSEQPDEKNNAMRGDFKSLFYICLSGTHASVEVRSRLIEELVFSENEDRQILGLELLDAALKTEDFTSDPHFSFGARSRDYGYIPNNDQDYLSWYKTFIDLCTDVAILSPSITQNARGLLTDKLRYLWLNAAIYDVIENAVIRIHSQRPWHEGWWAIRSIIYFDSEDFSEDVKERVLRLEKLLKPEGTAQLIRAYLLSGNFSIFISEDEDIGAVNFSSDKEKAFSRIQNISSKIQEMGKLVARDETLRKELFPEILRVDNTLVFDLGKGLAHEDSTREQIWSELIQAVKVIPLNQLRILLLKGFINVCSRRNPASCQQKLDEIIEDNVLKKYYLDFQRESPLDKKAVHRLFRSLNLDISPIDTYEYLVYDSLNNRDLISLLKVISSKEHGLRITINILSRRFYISSNKEKHYEPELINFGRQTLLAFMSYVPECHRYKIPDHALSIIAEVCLEGDDAVASAIVLCQAILSAALEREIFTYDYPELLSTLAKVQPQCFLDILVDRRDADSSNSIFSRGLRLGREYLGSIPDDVILEWCAKDSERRYVLISIIINPISNRQENSQLSWKTLAYSLLQNAPNPNLVLENFKRALYPRVYSGSLSDILESRLGLLEQLFDFPVVEVAILARRMSTEFRRRIDEDRQQESKWNKRKNESFE